VGAALDDDRRNCTAYGAMRQIHASATCFGGFGGGSQKYACWRASARDEKAFQESSANPECWSVTRSPTRRIFLGVAMLGGP
jgi:hypothetical protein